MLKKPKEKGRRHELRIAEILKGYGFTAFRTPLSGALEHWRGDITVKEQFPLFIEAKNCEAWKPLEWYNKANCECGPKVPVVVMTRNRADVFAFLLFSDLMNFITGRKTEVIKKPARPKRLTLEEGANLKFSKKWQIRKREKI